MTGIGNLPQTRRLRFLTNRMSVWCQSGYALPRCATAFKTTTRNTRNRALGRRQNDEEDQMSQITLTFPDGSTYEGEWEKGFMNGAGTFTSSDGTQKSGTWKNGELKD